MQQARQQGYAAPFFDPVSQLTSRRLTSLSGGAAQGLIASTPQSAGDIPSFQAFLDEYQQVTGNTLDDPTYTGFGYDALHAIVAAMTAANTSTDRSAIQYAITNLQNPCFSICFSTQSGGAFLAAKFYFVRLDEQGFVPDT
jgi:ABC-type branched-subunit amino acid transport system substrate-binding protein